MKVTTPITSLFVFVTSALAESSSVSFDNAYDNSGQSMNTVSCSNEPNGLASRFPTFGDLPSFPNIGGAQVVGGFGSPACGTCWHLWFQGRSINVTAIDHAVNGFNIAEAAMNTLTNGQAASFGRIKTGATLVPPSSCGL